MGLKQKNKRRQAHRNFTKSYWRAIARSEDAQFQYSQENINRMELGMAPRRLACVQHKKSGLLVEVHLPLELHHVFGMKEDTPQEDQTIIEMWPHQHAACDPDRKVNYEFIEWRGFQ